MRRKIIFVLAFAALGVCGVSSREHCLWAQTDLSQTPPTGLGNLRTANGQATLTLRSQAAVEGNLIRLGDLLQCGDEASFWRVQLTQPFAPAPRSGHEQRWTAEQIAAALTLRGIDAAAYTLAGAESCVVKRLTRLGETSSSLLEPDSGVVTASALTAASDGAWTPVAASDVSLRTAQQNAADAIVQYLQSLTGEHIRYEIETYIPPEAATHLLSRRAITAVAGGEAPWVGDQIFRLRLERGSEVFEVDIPAAVSLPPMVLAAGGSLARGQVLAADDLKLVPLPANARIVPAETFHNHEDLIGLELVRSLATGQVVTREHVRRPQLVRVGDSVEIRVTAGRLQITSGGRALQAGGSGDTILVEVLPHRKEVAAQIVAPGIVSVNTGS